MSLLSKIFSGGLGELVGKVGGVIDNLNLSGEEKQAFKLKMEALIQKRDSEIEQTVRIELQAKERVLVAELQQGDKFTKRARPTVVYAGLLFIGVNYVLVPIVGLFQGVIFKPLDLPTEFWAGWSGIVATWSIGRSLEKRGTQNRVTSAITGSLLLDKP
ncbi:MAG: hypothetical protein J3T61_01235 [Candidatus Brocadiales bacterium]|nr:hypothetical protein [Candidatus Bathyanammoxibius sp.]